MSFQNSTSAHLRIASSPHTEQRQQSHSKTKNSHKNTFFQTTPLGIWGTFVRSLEGVKGQWVALGYQFNRHTLGVFKVQNYLISKILILGIIMFSFLKKDLLFTKESNIFAATSIGKKNNNTTFNFFSTNPSKKTPANDFAPASPSELHQETVKNYIATFSEMAVKEMDRFGIPASISMAQGIIESRAGTSTLSVKNNNQFGIKCFSKSCPKGHCSNFTDDHHKDFFRKYKTPLESWREHSEFLQKGRYKGLQHYGKNYKAWATGLKQCGYATDPEYDAKLISVIQRYQLYKLDDL